MTEEEWLAATEPRAMLELLDRSVSERKMRLMACAVSYRYADLIAGEWFPSALHVAEDYADTRVATIEVMEVRSLASLLFREWRAHFFPTADQVLHSFFGGRVSAVQHLLQLVDERPNLNVATNIVWFATAAYPLFEPGCEGVTDEVGYQAIHAELATYPNLLRDIFGNPFRPIVADPAWLTPTVQSIASAIYADRAFDRLPILADALEEAGCTNADILLHCRQPCEHVRGCWVVDLVLGKE